ncbi:MAG TPA: DoxX family protein [Herpetosiphonaceae bacterium]
MQAATQAVPDSKRMVWTGYVLSILPVLFLLLDAVIKVLRMDVAVQTTIQLGYPESTVVGMGLVLLVCVVLYVIPQTSVLGAILLTGYLGGAISTHVRVGSDLFSLIFPALLGAMLWGGLFLRDARLRALIPLRKPAAL